jgi:uncharacterized protein YgiB involved in biofilm formation
MKRSRKLKLGLLGAAAPVLLSACGGDEPRSYTSLQDCLKDPRQDAGLCQTAYDRARAAHLAGAERFPNRALCESQSQMPCEPLGTRTDSSVYIARLAGFEVEPQYRQRSSGSWWQYAAAYAAGSILGGGGGWQQRPVYRDYGNQGWSGGENRSSRPDNSWSSSGGDGGKISTATLSRGGFGGAAAARSSWGG